MNRTGELGNPPMRTDRFFAVNGSWYFSTRENMSIGPYTDKQEAVQGLNNFIEYMSLQKAKRVLI